MFHDDILQPLTNHDDLLKLRDVYRDVRPSASHIYNYLSTVIRRKTLEPNSNCCSIFVPHGKLENGTFIGIQKSNALMYTLEADCKDLIEALEKSKRFDWTVSWVLYCITKHHLPHIVNALKTKGHQFSQIGECDIWWLDRENSRNFSISCPEEVYISPLDLTHASRINSFWPGRHPGSEKYVIDMIQFGGGYGVFLKSDGLLVAWALHNPIGIGNIQTVPEHMRKGYGTLVGKYISKKIAEQGCDPLGSVRNINTASQRMFSKMGFELINTVAYVFGKDHVPADMAD